MNNRLEIQSFQVVFTDGTKGEVPSQFHDTFLVPFYASIHDIEISLPIGTAAFTDEFALKVAEIIFNKSIWIDLYTKRKGIKLSEEDMFILKRDYVICATLAQIGTILYGIILKGQSVKKVLGDFEVNRDLDYDTDKALNFAKDAKKCMEDIVAEIDKLAATLADPFLLGSLNCRNRRADRLWHHPPFLSKMPIAANKMLEWDGRFYKTGFGHGNEYIPLYTRD